MRWLASKLLYYDGQSLRFTNLPGHLRGLAWDREDRSLIVVGNGGRILRIQEGRSVSVDSGTRHNLRAVSVNNPDGTALIVGNAGTALLLDEEGDVAKVNAPTFENLRAVSWHPEGFKALIAGNNGALLKYSRNEILTVETGRANLRDVSWRPKSNSALIASNCFAEEFIPSPNLFNYESEANLAKPVNEGRADLIGVAWKPDGDSALVVGYDVVWHNGFIGEFSGSALSQIQFENKYVYPVAAAWNPSSDVAAVVTAIAQVGMGKGEVLQWDGRSLNPIFSDADFFFSDAAWKRNGGTLAALASTETRTFNA